MCNNLNNCYMLACFGVIEANFGTFWNSIWFTFQGSYVCNDALGGNWCMMKVLILESIVQWGLFSQFYYFFSLKWTFILLLYYCYKRILLLYYDGEVLHGCDGDTPCGHGRDKLTCKRYSSYMIIWHFMAVLLILKHSLIELHTSRDIGL